MILKLGQISPYVAFLNKLDSIHEWASQLKSDASIGNLTFESHGNVVHSIERDMEQANMAWIDIREKIGMPVPQNGLILGMLRNHPEGEFVVLTTVRAVDGPFDVESYIKEISRMRLDTGAKTYTAVWFQPTEVPRLTNGS